MSRRHRPDARRNGPAVPRTHPARTGENTESTKTARTTDTDTSTGRTAP
ncbi:MULTISPECIES: hypothetical protein [Streptosporangium]|uniref:Uncharacterized protein n=1 Tax=Streptosporangium brasiliense TaxID=47480 RepID=A0ABT9RHR0_9ACTN|nr:hypothetical protein [Streptosporangium brasiliense]MDP9868386.1 hypothetical protein [Streptosporangium brasiliense]